MYASHSIGRPLRSTLRKQADLVVGPIRSPALYSDVPLAVRTPYLSAWLPQKSGAALNGVWPAFWEQGNKMDSLK